LKVHAPPQIFMVCFLIAFVIFGLGSTYYLEDLRNSMNYEKEHIYAVEDIVGNIERTDLEFLKLAEVFRRQNLLIETKDELILTLIDFQKIIWSGLLLLLLLHLYSQIMYFKGVRKNET
jgi:hypothetical protein